MWQRENWKHILYDFPPANRQRFDLYIFTVLLSARSQRPIAAPRRKFISGSSCHGPRYMIHFKMICYATAGLAARELTQCRCLLPGGCIAPLWSSGRLKSCPPAIPSSQMRLVGLAILLPICWRWPATFSHNPAMGNAEKLPSSNARCSGSAGCQVLIRIYSNISQKS